MPKKITRQGMANRRKALRGQHNVSVWISAAAYNRLKGLAGLLGLRMGGAVEAAILAMPIPEDQP